MVVDMYYAVDTSNEMVHAFRIRSYRDGYVISNYEAKAITPAEARAIMADYIGEPKTMYTMPQLCERYAPRHHVCNFDGCMLGCMV